MFIKNNILNLAKDASFFKNSKAFEAAGQAVAELVTAGCIGSACVQQGHLDHTAVQYLSKTCFTILLPMFLGTSIMTTIHKYGLRLSSISVPLIAIVHVWIMYAISRYVLLPIFGINGESVEGRATSVCCAFGNAGVVPLIFVEALFRDSDFFPRASSMVSMYLIGWSPLFWSFGRRILVGREDHAYNALSKNSTYTLRDKISLLLKPLFPPPVMGVTLGFLLAYSPVSRCLLMRCQSDTQKAPLEVIFHSFRNLGRAANPMALLVLTSSLALGVSKQQDIPDNNHNHNHNHIPLQVQWSCVSMARFIISPLFMWALLHMAHQCGWMGSMTQDGIDSFLQWFILILESTMPSAQNSVLMLQVSGKRSEASRLARFLFTIYGTAMIPLIIVSTLLLHHLNKHFC